MIHPLVKMFWWSTPEPLSVRLIKELTAHPMFSQLKQAADLGYSTILPLTVAQLLVGNQWEPFFTALATDAGRTYVRSDPLIAEEVFNLCLIHRRSELHQIFPGSPPLIYASYDHDYCQLDQRLPQAFAKYRPVMQEFRSLPKRQELRKIADRGYTDQFMESIRTMALRKCKANDIIQIMELFLTCQGMELLRDNPKMRLVLQEKLVEFSRHDKLMGNPRLEHVYRRLYCVSQSTTSFYFRSESNVQANNPSPSKPPETPDQSARAVCV